MPDINSLSFLRNLDENLTMVQCLLSHMKNIRNAYLLSI